MDRGWGEPSADMSARMLETVSRDELLCPTVPRWMAPSLREHADGWAWSTDDTIDPWLVYTCFGELPDGPLISDRMSEAQPDFFLFGHRGYGINSYGLGLVARLGAVMVAQQFGWGGHLSGSSSAVNRGTTAWNETFPAVLPLLDEQLRVVVLFSNYRQYGLLLRHQPEEGAPRWERGRRRSFPPGWHVLWDRREREMPFLRALRNHDDPAVKVAARHLVALYSKD